MAVDPVPSLWNSDDSQEISAINYGTGNAGSFLPSVAGTEYHIWNDKGYVKGSSKMTSVLATIRDSDGKEVLNLTTQHWGEIKSNGIGPRSDDFATTDVDTATERITVSIDIPTGEEIKFTTTDTLPSPLVVGTLYFAIRIDATHIKVATTLANAIAGTAINLTTVGVGTHTVTIYMVDDAMSEFQAVGKDAFLSIGSIPANCYRKIFVRLRIPTSGLKAGVSFKIYITNQQAQSSISTWITGLHGNGVVYLASGAFGVSINGGDASLLDIEKGFSLIIDSSVYYGNSQQYDVSGLSNGTYKIYLTQAGIISSILEASEIPSNSIELTRAVIVSGECTGVTDKRNFIATVMAGLDAAKTATPTINQVYIATDTTKVYACFVDDSWTIIYDPNVVTKTGTFTAGRMVKINNASGIIEMATNTDTEVADAVTKKHTQGTDQKLDDGGANEVAVGDLKANLVNQVLTSGTAISWDMANGSRATLIAAHNFTITITKLTAVLKAILIVSQDGTGNRVLDEIITQKDDSIATSDVHTDTEIIDIGIDIPTGARIRFKTSAADLPDPLVVDTIYYAIRVSATEIKVATTPANAFAGTAIDITDQGTGTHEVQQLVKWPGGTLGVLQVAAGAEDIINLHYKASDEQWYAELVSNFS